ncbi:MAG: alpha-L-arabinofuranosidase C-terminal domain-containing protein [Anaerolineae bacterium]
MRRVFIVVLGLCLMGLVGLVSSSNVQSQPAPHIVIDLNHPGASVNPYIFGSNLQWNNYGDWLLVPETLAFHPDALAMLQALAPTVLRYPGGGLADTFHWRAGLGDLDERGQVGDEVVSLGLMEFLTLCQLVGAEPLYTLNVITETPAENAELVESLNAALAEAGNTLPPIRYWEVGNEPYLQNDLQPELNITPAEYAIRANATIQAIKAVDPSILVGIPLQSDYFGNLPATPYQGYNQIVLETMTEPFDFVAVHNAYRPLAITGPRDDEALYLASMAAARGVEEDLNHIRSQLAEYGYADMPIAVTEYNTLFSIGLEPVDSYITSLASALYVADLLHLLAAQQDILMANYWSAIGNWYFGAISFQYQPRPAYHVLQIYSEKFQGKRYPVTVTSPTFSNPEIGFVLPYEDTPILSVAAVQDGDTLRVFIINKALEPYAVDLSALEEEEERRFASGSIMLLTDDSPFAGAVPFSESAPLAWQTSELPTPQLPLNVELPPHSLVIVELQK